MRQKREEKSKGELELVVRRECARKMRTILKDRERGKETANTKIKKEKEEQKERNSKTVR